MIRAPAGAISSHMAMRAMMAAKESWKLGPIRLSGQRSRTMAAAQATRRMEIG
jgi:hypothetical protein